MRKKEIARVWWEVRLGERGCTTVYTSAEAHHYRRDVYKNHDARVFRITRYRLAPLVDGEGVAA